MEIITASLVSLATFLIGIIGYYTSIGNYWARKKIPYDKESQIASFFKKVLQKYVVATTILKQYKGAKAAGHKSYGLYRLWTPIYMPIDPIIIKNILSVDFQVFTNHGFYYNKESDPIGAHLFALEGEEWKNLRVKLTPTFTSGKMKMMIHTVIECAENFKKSVDRLAALDDPINISDLAKMFTTDVIGSCAFGLDCNSFENPNSDFLKYSKLFFQPNLKTTLKNILSFNFPDFAKFIGLCSIDKEVSKFFINIVKETIEYREKNNVVRHDFMQLLLNLRNDPVANEKSNFTLEVIAAQAFVFFVAGYETSSSTMSFLLYELSVNPDIQQIVREEINSVLENHDGKVTYEAIMDMKYMKQTIDETLRKYPPLPVLFRKSSQDYLLPGTDQILEKGTFVYIPTIGLHHDTEFYPDPEKFDPDRFSTKNKSKINPFTYLPFGEGPRNCIGIRFGIMQAKVGLTYLLKNYKFSLNEKTQTPLAMNPKSFMLSVLGGLWLNTTKIK